MNVVTLIILLLLIVPILSGASGYFSRERIQQSIWSLLGNMEILVGIFISIYFARKVMIEHTTGIYKKIYELVPENIRLMLAGQDVLTYIIFVPAILLLFLFVIRLVMIPVYRALIPLLTEVLFKLFNSMNGFLRRALGALSQIPKALFMVFLFGLLLNFYTYYFYSPFITKYMNESNAYQFIYKNAIYPVLNSNIAKQIPVIVNDSFRKSFSRDVPGGDNSADKGIAEKIARELEKRNIKVIEYFNGVTLDEAVKSNEEIDAAAKKIAGKEKNSNKKAYLLYKWVSKSIEYDYDKAAEVSKDPRGISSGAVTAYETRKGICFDYSSLYVAMCRAVGLKVRLVTGLGYSGISWGDHAWNQVYSVEEKRWINVDSTFGVSGNYFDKPDFNVDHRDADVQGEW